jgi:flagellar motor protein MotB
MASIFIVLSVVSMTTLARKFYDYEKPSDGESQVACRVVQIPGDALFQTSQYTLKSAGAKKEIRDVLADLPEHIQAIKDYAQAQGWEDYYVILEAGGHADDDPYLDGSGNDENWRLSTARAITVIQEIERNLRADSSLRAKLGVVGGSGEATPGSTVLRAAGYSYHLPFKSFSKAKGRARADARSENRRVEIRLFAQPVAMVHLNGQ